METITAKTSAPPATAASPAADTLTPALIVFGLDDGGKAHTSWFTEAEAELALKAAGLMGMGALRVTADEHRLAAATLLRRRVSPRVPPSCRLRKGPRTNA